MEMEGVEQTTAVRSPAVPPPESLNQEQPPLQQHQQQQQQQQHQHQRTEQQPSPVVSEVQPPPASPAPAPAGHQTSNGVVPGAQPAAASPATRSGTPLSHPSHPSTPPVVNGQGHTPMLPLSQIADASLSASAAAAVNAVASANNAARAKEHLRWRDPITVQYDGGGVAQPAKVHTSQVQQHQQHQQPQTAPPPPTSTQLTQLPLPAPAAPPPSQQQHQTQYSHPHQHPHQHQHQHPQHQQPPAHSYQNHHPQPQHQHPHPQQHADPLPPLAHQHQHQHHQQPHPHGLPLSQHHQLQHHLPPHQQQRHRTPPAPALRQPPPFSSSSQPPSEPSTALPPLHHVAPPASSQPLPSARTIAIHAGASITNKPIIMDPPGHRAAQAQPGSPRTAGFASPSPDYARINPKFNDDCQRMVFAVQQSLPESVRRVIRDNWEKCLLGTEFHQAFILNASIHHALPSITRRAVRDFGRKMVTESREDLMDHFTVADIDAVADRIIAKASDSFLDKCLEKRLLTIEAKPLINALAKAERLGYDPADVVQEDHHERVIPQEAYPGAGPAPSTSFSQQRTSLPPQPVQSYTPPAPTTQCPRCFRTFTYPEAHSYHMRNNVCSAQPPTAEGFKHACGPCGQGFTTIEELQAHGDSRVCGGYSSKTPRGPGRPPRAAPIPQGNPVAILPSMQTPGPNGYQMQQPQPQSTPTPAQSASRRTASAVATPTGSPNPADPYAHLKPEDLAKMNAELAEAEAKYAPRFKEAEQHPDENVRRQKIEGLRNSFGTKQSMIRKKYGVRLRERRTKAEIQAEKERLGIKRAERAEREKARAAMGAVAVVSGVMSPGVKLEPSVRPAGSSGWVAANTPRASNVWEEHDAKRRRMDEAGGYQTPYKSEADDTPTRKALTVEQIGGGLSATATAATHDPTLPPPSQPAKEIQKPVQAPTNGTPDRPNTASSGTPAGDAHQVGTAAQSSRNDPINIDDDSSGSSDDEDIPSTVPPHASQGLAPHRGGAAVMS
ncbi:hypothetical protein B0T16DRAFT_393901 [Cercophora newfieldiana]|uniref:Uncharacterized protein n=1 Tax=Cercophora newfieldiana TaxID=92897 RepID=A0AA39XXL7_9PEZI|nr:hypothetical protein B0T16DRAFT_393901 [Cercophora newfieldiana]